MGYRQAGFEVVGVDICPQKNYPFEFHQGDALDFAIHHGYEFDFIHASPPCQFFSELTPPARKHLHPNLIPQTREILLALGEPYIIENVEAARGHLVNPLMLCGSMFGLPIWRHRYFENSPGLFASPAHCNHNFKPILVSGTTGSGGKGLAVGIHRKENTAEEKRQAMGTPWMTEKEVTQAIPPAYTQWLGQKAIKHLQGATT